MTLEEILPLLDKVKRYGQGYVACCPAHDDRNPSLAIDTGKDGRILMKCWAGCDIHSIATGMGVTVGDLMGEAKGHRLSPLYGLGRKKFVYDKRHVEKIKSGVMTQEVADLILKICKNKREDGLKLTSKDLADERRAFDFLRGAA